jgi:23S rRNA (adenine2503-C2)-methyltransferase
MTGPDLQSMLFDELQEWFIERGEKAFRGRQVFRWLHAKCAKSFEEMTDLSKVVRARLADAAALKPVAIAEQPTADDETVKFRYRLHDGESVEGVYIPEPGSGKQKARNTLCVSTQVGCGMGCAFCATATMGFVRNLSAGEIAGQLEAVVRLLCSGDKQRPVTNVVFMGMGEPLANLDAVVRAVKIMLHQSGYGLSRRHLTVSTAGLVPAMEEFVHQVPAKLAVSLNATTDEVRSRIMPVNRKFPLKVLMACCRNLPLMHTDRVTFEYVMLKGIHDSSADARRLVSLLSGIRAKVNLIPFNPYPGVEYGRPDQGQVEAFRELLASRNISAFVRRSRGDTLQGACGQLVVKRGNQ